MGAGILAPGYIQIPGVLWARFFPDTIIHIYLVIISAVVLMARVRLFAQRLLRQQNSFFRMLLFFHGPSVEDSWWHFFRVCAWACEILCPIFSCHRSPLRGKCSSQSSCHDSMLVCHSWKKWEPTAPLIKFDSNPVEKTTSPNAIIFGLPGLSLRAVYYFSTLARLREVLGPGLIEKHLKNQIIPPSLASTWMPGNQFFNQTKYFSYRPVSGLLGRVPRQYIRAVCESSYDKNKENDAAATVRCIARWPVS